VALPPGDPAPRREPSTRPTGSAASFEIDLPLGVQAPGRARDLVRALWTESGATSAGALADATLVVQELVSNALTHGEPNCNGDIEVSGWIDQGYVVVSVLDMGTTGTVAALPQAVDREHGRGLSIVAALSTSWSVDRTVGTRVTAQIRV
jgi:anti-sigma regulatory factor (Ser/Thr protein kinase)